MKSTYSFRSVVFEYSHKRDALFSYRLLQPLAELFDAFGHVPTSIFVNNYDGTLATQYAVVGFSSVTIYEKFCHFISVNSIVQKYFDVDIINYSFCVNLKLKKD